MADTTIGVSYKTQEALSRRTRADETLEDVIIRLINNGAVGYGKLTEGGEVDLVWDDVEPVDDAERIQCDNYDAVDGQCEEWATYKQDWRYPNEDEWSTFFYCEDHAPDTIGEVLENDE